MIALRSLGAACAALFASTAVAADKPAPKPADPRCEALLKAGYTAVPLTYDDGQLVAEGQVLTEKGKFLVNTGTHLPLIERKVARKLKLEFGDRVPTAGSGGSADGRVVRLPGLTLGGYDTRKDVNRMPAVAADLSKLGNNLSGSLGVQALDVFAPVIDYPARTLYLRPPLKTAWPKLAGKWTVTSWKEEGAKRDLDPKSPPTLDFADHRLKLTDGGKTREFGIQAAPDGGDYTLVLFDPKQEGKTDIDYQAGGLVRVDGGTMTACLFLDIAKVKGMPTAFDAPKGSGFVLLEMTTADRRPAAPDPLRDLLTKDGYTAVPLSREATGERVLAGTAGKQELLLHLDTGTTVTYLDTEVVNNLKADPVGQLHKVRGLKLGGYDTRATAATMFAATTDYAAINSARNAHQLPPLHGTVGQMELHGGSAVIDLHSDTLYLRPLKQTVGPRVEGKWVGAEWEQDGRKGKYTPDEVAALEFKDGRLVLTHGKKTFEWAFHVVERGTYYRLDLFDPKKKEDADELAYDMTAHLKLADDKLSLLTPTGAVKAEPTRFAAPKGSGLLLIEFERAK